MSEKRIVYLFGEAMEVDHSEPIDIPPETLMTDAQRRAMCPHWSVESICIDDENGHESHMIWRCDQCGVPFAPEVK